MKLWLVTWDTDLTQFLVEADNENEAVNAAILINKKLEEPEDTKTMLNRDEYSVDPVDFSLLSKIILRTDIWYSGKDGIAFVD